MTNPNPHIFTDAERRKKALPGQHKRYTINVPEETHAELKGNTERVRAILRRFAEEARAKCAQ